MGLKVGKGDAIANTSADTLTACISDVMCTCVDFHPHRHDYEVRGGSRGRMRGVRTPPPPTLRYCGFLMQLAAKKNMWCRLVTSQLRHSLVVHPLLR